MARQHLLLAAAALLAVAAQAHLASEWPKQPLGAPIELRADAANDVLLDSARRELADKAAAGKPESYEIFHIILWSSIGIALALFFSVLALVNMDVGNDSMLYSKAKTD